MKYCVCHFSCCLHVEPVQTGYPWQPFYNARRNTSEEVPFYLGWRAGVEAAEKSNKRPKVIVDGIFFSLAIHESCSLKWCDLQKKKKKRKKEEKKKKLQAADWLNNEKSPGKAGETWWHNILSVWGLNIQKKALFFFSSGRVDTNTFVAFIPSAWEGSIAARASQRHSGTGVRSAGAPCPGSWRTSPVMWNTAGASVMRGSVCVSVCECVCVWWRGSKVESGGGQHWGRCSAQPAGSSAGESHSPCQQPTGPIREEFGLHPCMQIMA